MTESQRRRWANAKQGYAMLMKCYPLATNDIDNEEWKDIAGYEGIYQVSNYGRVKSFARRTKWEIRKPYINNGGYLCISLWRNGKGKKIGIHRLVAQAFIPNTAGKSEVNHRDGCKFNNHVSNLEWATSSENNQHAVAIGLKPSGENCYLARLTNEQVNLIRENPDNLTMKQLAEIFDVTLASISYIQLGQVHKNAGGKLRKAQKRVCLSHEEKKKICMEYVYHSREFGSVALSKKYGVDRTTILNIVNGK